MKPLYLAIFLSLFSGCSPSDILDRIPDKGFRKYLIAQFDNNHDGIISQSEALEVTEMAPGYCYHIKEMRGIKYFKKLETLEINCGVYKSIDLRHNHNLKRFRAMNLNQLTSVKLNKNLEELSLIRIKPLTIKNICNMPKLRYVSIIECRIEPIKKESLPKLKELHITDCETENQINRITSVED